MQTTFGMDKKEAVKELGKQRIELLKQYADQYKTLTSEQADVWTKKVMDLQKKTDNLITTYDGKVRTATDGIVALQFYQMDNYILAAIRAQLLEQIPFVEKKN